MSGILWEFGPVAVLEELAPDGEVVLLAGFADLATAGMVAHHLTWLSWPATVESLADDGPWRHAWREHAEPVTVGPVLVWPGWWSEQPPDQDGVVVRLDPGSAFGSGSHPSTRMCLAALAAGLSPGDRVLDLGCGSGVLSVVAALLGSREVVAVDTDPEAVAVTGANAAANDVAGLVQVHEGSIETVDGTFDVVLANIGAAVLTDLAPAIAAAVADGGHLVLAGMLVGQEPDVVAAFGAAGLALVGTDDLDGWGSAVLRR